MSDGTTNGTQPLLEARNIVQEFVVRGRGGVKGGVVQAVSDVSLEVRPGLLLPSRARLDIAGWPEIDIFAH